MRFWHFNLTNDARQMILHSCLEDAAQLSAQYGNEVETTQTILPGMF